MMEKGEQQEVIEVVGEEPQAFVEELVVPEEPIPEKEEAPVRPAPAPLVAPFPLAPSASLRSGISDPPAYTSEAELLSELASRKDKLLGLVREAGHAIPAEGLSAAQRQALLQVKAIANGNALKALGEFAMLLGHARRSRWISYETYADGCEMLASVQRSVSRG